MSRKCKPRIIAKNTKVGKVLIKGNNYFTNLLFNILRTMRPAFTATEEVMIKTFIDVCDPKIDSFGNRIIVVPMKDGTASKTLFSCHTDTVHSKQGMQTILLDTEKQDIFVDDSDCLGADDGTGIAIMLTMIKHKIPGTYIFHRAEERGGLGSSYIKNNQEEFLSKFDRAIAFDRKNEDDVIIAQSVGIIASKECGDALAADLNEDTEFKFKNCTFGSFTDTANYFTFIPECFNLSVGYNYQHTPREIQNLTFLETFVPKVLSLQWEQLPTVRKAGPAESKYPSSVTEPYKYNDYYGSDAYGAGAGSNSTYDAYKEYPINKGYIYLTNEELADIVRDEPFTAVKLLSYVGTTEQDLLDVSLYTATIEDEAAENDSDNTPEPVTIYGDTLKITTRS